MSIEHIEINRRTSAQMFKLPKDMIDYLWERIDVAKKKKICQKKNLAGHVSHSYKLEDPQNLIVPNLFNILEKVQQDINSEIQKTFFKLSREDSSPSYELQPHLNSLWVNFQKKGEFQPLHDHSGLMSFVIWMDIPYHWKDEAKLPFARSSNADRPSGGNFSFLYSNGNCRNVQTRIIKMSPEMNGYCCFFPSDLSHMVYPFYTSDKERISISGNIVFKMEDSSEQRSQQFPFIVSNT